jgi:prevent-host-death family protein
MATEGEIKAPINANIINASEARNSFAQVLADVDAGRCDFLIKRNNKIIAAIIPASDYTKIVEELISLRAINHALAYSEAYKQGKARTVAWGDLKEKLSKVIEAGEAVEDINVEVAETSE